MKIHPEALRQIIRAMEKDLQKEMPASRAVTERKNHETEFEAITVYHNPPGMVDCRCDRNVLRHVDDRNDPRRGGSGTEQTQPYGRI